MHNIIVTEGIILSKRGVGEANTLVTILTSDLGLVRVSARSARLDVSKLRYGLEVFTRARFSLVRGRYEWKLTGVDHPVRLAVLDSLHARQAAGRVARLLLRLIHGEEPVPELYRTLLRGFDALASVDDRVHAEGVECVLVLQILFQLGYVSNTAEVAPFVDAAEWHDELLGQALSARARLVRVINASLAATGL